MTITSRAADGARGFAEDDVTWANEIGEHRPSLRTACSATQGQVRRREIEHIMQTDPQRYWRDPELQGELFRLLDGRRDPSPTSLGIGPSSGRRAPRQLASGVSGQQPSRTTRRNLAAPPSLGHKAGHYPAGFRGADAVDNASFSQATQSD